MSCCAWGEDFKSIILDYLESGLEVTEKIKSLTEDDVIDSARLRVETEERDLDKTVKYYRGDENILSLYHLQSGTVSFTIMFDGNRPFIGSRLQGSDRDVYGMNGDFSNLVASIEIVDNGTREIVVYTKDGQKAEKFILDGANTRPVDALAYMKLSLSVMWATKATN
jgi:hypothetical protein